MNELDNNIYSIAVSIDRSNACDRVNHKTLLQKMFNYGIWGIVLEWFDDYLPNHIQCVSVNNTNSKILPIQYGVSQGSILGPFLFILLINDIIDIFIITEFITFADDNKLLSKTKI